VDAEVVKGTIEVALRSRARYCNFRALSWIRAYTPEGRIEKDLWKVEAQNCLDLADAVEAADAAALSRTLRIVNVRIDNANDDEDG
jgi:hypothetical protein